jgi:transcriptional regulator with XRE-family HTH domain
MIQNGSMTKNVLIQIEQFRAARGLLGRSQTKLATMAGLSLPTVKRVESGLGPPVSEHARERLRRALQEAGVEFIDDNGGGPGVRLRKLPRQSVEDRPRFFAKRTQSPSATNETARRASSEPSGNRREMRPARSSIPTVKERPNAWTRDADRMYCATADCVIHWDYENADRPIA